MAKKEETPKAPRKISSFFNSLRSTTGSTSYKDSKFSEPNHYIDTGSYALNRICSGSIYKGIPSGSVILLQGESSSGKSLMAVTIIANALNKNNYDAALYFDAEGGAPLTMLENVGVDTSKVEHILVENIEDATVKILSAYKQILEFQQTNPDFKALLILDSLGALVPNKLFTDVEEKGRPVADQGARAKSINNMVKGLTIPALKSQCSIMILNHVYDAPGQMYPSKIKMAGGGKGIQFMSSLTIQCDRRLEKPEDKAEENGFYDRTFLKFFTVKTRGNVRPFLETEVPLSFTHGYSGTEYYGLIPPAMQYGFITKPKPGWYAVKTFPDKLFRLSDLEGGPEAKKIWDTFIDEFDKVSESKICYSKLSQFNADNLISEQNLEVLQEAQKEINE